MSRQYSQQEKRLLEFFLQTMFVSFFHTLFQDFIGTEEQPNRACHADLLIFMQHIQPMLFKEF